MDNVRSSKTNKSIQELRQYCNDKVAIINLKERLSMVEDKMYSIKSSIGGDSVRGGSGEDRLTSLIETKEKYLEAIDNVERHIAIVERSLEALSDEDSLVISKFFLEGLYSSVAVETLMQELSTAESCIWYRRRKALERYAHISGLINDVE